MYKNTEIFLFLQERKVPCDLISKTLCKFKMSENAEFKLISVCFAVLILIAVKSTLLSQTSNLQRRRGERKLLLAF